MMTIVKKNGFEENPDHNYGATIYRKQRKKKALKETKGENSERESNIAGKGRQSVVDKDVCIKNVMNWTESARVRREKRLYTHLGLRGMLILGI